MRPLRTLPAWLLLLESRGQRAPLLRARLDELRQCGGTQNLYCLARGGRRCSPRVTRVGRPSPADERRALWRAAFRRSRLVGHLGHCPALCSPSYRGQFPECCLLAAAPFVCRGTEGCARFGEGQAGGRLYRHRAPRNKLYHPGGTRCHPRRHLFHRDLRRDHGARLYAHVSAGTCHQVDGHQDGAFGRRCRRNLRRLSLFPQGAQCRGIPQRDRSQTWQTAHVRLSARQQESVGVGC